MIVMNQNNGSAADHGAPLPGEIKRHDGNFLHVDVKPDVELGPIRERKYANAFPLVDPGVEDVPQLRALILGVPLPLAVPERIDSLLGPRFFFVAAGTAKGRVKPAFSQGVEQRLGLDVASRSIFCIPRAKGFAP